MSILSARGAKPLLFGVFLVLALLALALAVRGGRRPRYIIGMLNETGHTLDRVGVYYGRRMAAAGGRLVPGGYATFGFVTMPIPPAAELRWLQNGVEHAAQVKLLGIVPPGFTDGNVYFIFKVDGSLDVKTAKSHDREANNQILDELHWLDAGPK
jgi:hypothetical protein